MSDRRQWDLLREQEWLEEQNGNTGDKKKMGFTARQQGGSFKPLAAQVYAGVATLLADVGMQPGGRYKDAYKVVIGFELPDAPPRDDGKPVMIYKNVTNSMDKKANLRKLIESWFGKQFESDEAAKKFDLSKILGRSALVNVTNDERNGKVYANIGGLTPLMAGMAPPKAKGETVFYSEIVPETAGNKEKLPEWIVKLIDESQIREGEPLETTAASATDGGDDIPF